MDKLWAPWRIKYIKNPKRKKCIFCPGNAHRRESYVIFRSKYSTAMLNAFPYNNGHMLIAPKRHIAGFTGLKEGEVLDLFYSLSKAKKLLDKVLKPHGYNIGINLSRSAGAGITGHLHIHIVPRWEGDTNFMPVLYDTKIISQSLEELYKRLRHAYAKSD